MWQLIRGRRLGVSFRRQVPIRRYIADILAPARRHIVAVDGGYHQQRRGADAHRDLTSLGDRVLRLPAALVTSQPSQALALIVVALKTPETQNPPCGGFRRRGRDSTPR